MQDLWKELAQLKITVQTPSSNSSLSDALASRWRRKVPHKSGSDVTEELAQAEEINELPYNSTEQTVTQASSSAPIVEDIPSSPNPSTPQIPPLPPKALKLSRTGHTCFLPAQFIDVLPTLSQTMPNTVQLPEQSLSPLPVAATPPSQSSSNPEPQEHTKLEFHNTDPDDTHIPAFHI
ncbi:hypothetical protein K435DRAFT_851126 [Dendrothele bispora CBS 962.96]|uniref:Uncharacterized protein n=1 Tax=Dendrothele bispora (strain CBS 962.96) TaxID=1314807 RepID=A0A4S8MMX6_DENBC|nr:hypothetical protein K435DRAFT_851126 [Dendrothele bispora CBS 962.96]